MRKVRHRKPKAKAKRPRDPFAPAVNAAVRQKYAPQERSLAQQGQASELQDQRITNYWGQYQLLVQQAQARQQQAYQQGQGAVAQYGQQAQAADQGGVQQLQSQMQQDAASRGASVDPQIAALGQQAATNRAGLLGSSLASMANAGAAQAGYVADLGPIGQGTANLQHQDESRLRQLLAQKQQGLQGEKADYGQSVRSSLVKDALNQQIASQELGIKVGQLGVNRQNASTSRLAAKSLSGNRKKTAKETARYHRELNASKNRGLSDAEAKDAYQRKHGVGPYKPAAGNKPKAETQASRNVKRDINNTLGDYRSKHGSRDKKGRVWSYSRIHQDMLRHGVPRDVANAALDLAVHGYLSRPNIAALRRAGVRIPREWKGGRRKAKQAGFGSAIDALGGVLDGFK